MTKQTGSTKSRIGTFYKSARLLKQQTTEENKQTNESCVESRQGFIDQIKHKQDSYVSSPSVVKTGFMGRYDGSLEDQIIKTIPGS